MQQPDGNTYGPYTLNDIENFAVQWRIPLEAMLFHPKQTNGQWVAVARKWAVKGSKAGLFYATDLRTVERPERLIVCEGPTDTASMLSVGLHAVGVPSAGGGIDLLVALCRRMLPEHIQVMADDDGPGAAGAERVADALVIMAPVVIVTPLGGCKDSRAWVVGGAGRDAIVAAGDVAPVRRMTIHGGAI